MIKNLKPTPVT